MLNGVTNIFLQALNDGLCLNVPTLNIKWSMKDESI